MDAQFEARANIRRSRIPSLSDESIPYDARYGPAGFDFSQYEKVQNILNNITRQPESYGIDPFRGQTSIESTQTAGNTSTFNPSNLAYTPQTTSVPTGKETASPSTPSTYNEILEKVKTNLSSEETPSENKSIQVPSFNINEFQDLLTRLEGSKKAQVAQKGTEGRRGIMSKGMQSMFRTF